MNIPDFLTKDPKVLVKKLTKVGFYLLAVMAILIYIKFDRDREEKKIREREDQKRALAATQKVKQEINWEEQVKTILPEQEELLTPNVLPQLLLPPLLDKIHVPEAIVYIRKKRYTAAFDFKKTPPISFWSSPASAGGLDLSAPVSMDMPPIRPPLSSVATPARKPRPLKGVGQTYILLP